MNLLFWRRRDEVDTDPRDIDRLIFDIAEQRRPRDFRLLYQRLRDMPLFAPVIDSTVADTPAGTPHVVQPNEKITLPVPTLPSGGRFTPFCVADDDPRLTLRYARFTARAAFERTLADPDLDGLLLQNRGISWVALPRRNLKRLLKRYLS